MEGGLGALLRIASVSYHLSSPAALFVYLKQPTFVHCLGNEGQLPADFAVYERISFLQELVIILLLCTPPCCLVPLQLLDTI